MTEAEAMWAERVLEWKASGQTAPEFAGPRGYASSTLRYWASRLRQQARSVPERGGGVSVSAVATPIRMARVVRVDSVESTPMVIVIGQARLEVRRGFDALLLREVVEALGGGQ